MSKNTRTEAQILDDKVRISKLYLQGKTQNAIAAEIKVSRSQIQYDLKKIFLEWKEERIEVFEDSLLKELNELKLLKSEAWEAWEKSKQDSEKMTSKTILSKDKNDSKNNANKDTTNVIEVSETIEGQNPNPKYLDIVFRCIETNLKILCVLPKKENSREDINDNDIELIEGDVDLEPNGR